MITGVFEHIQQVGQMPEETFFDFTTVFYEFYFNEAMLKCDFYLTHWN